MNSIEDLVCGIEILPSPFIDGDYVGLVRRLRSDLATLHPQIRSAVRDNTNLPASAVFPFLARKFLELSLTGLLARLDPIRVIAARKNQNDASFLIDQSNPSSISWTGDLLPKPKLPTSNNWASENIAKGPERSLLGWHFGEVAITPGLQYLADLNNTDSIWLRELASQDNPFNWIKGRLKNLYSTLSKGVHFEYLLDDHIDFDNDSIQQHMNDCFKMVFLLAAATHVSPLFSRSIPIANAIEALTNFESMLNRRAHETN